MSLFSTRKNNISDNSYMYNLISNTHVNNSSKWLIYNFRKVEDGLKLVTKKN